MRFNVCCTVKWGESGVVAECSVTERPGGARVCSDPAGGDGVVVEVHICRGGDAYLAPFFVGSV